MIIQTTKKGIILILTFIIMVALTSITIAFLYMTSIQTKNSGYNIASSKALWIAEAGIQRGIWLIEEGDWSTGFGSGQTREEEGSLGEGNYVVTASRAGNNYTLDSTGTVAVISRSVQQIFDKQSGHLNPVADSWQEL